MTADDFLASARGAPAQDLSPALQALWWCAQGEWDRAHEIAQDDYTRDGSWVHAHLHRVEGDLGNAAYWYRRAQQPVCSAPLPEERRAMVAELLDRK